MPIYKTKSGKYKIRNVEGEHDMYEGALKQLRAVEEREEGQEIIINHGKSRGWSGKWNVHVR